MITAVLMIKLLIAIYSDKISKHTSLSFQQEDIFSQIWSKTQVNYVWTKYYQTFSFLITWKMRINIPY